jgi:hypothetical protein
VGEEGKNGKTFHIKGILGFSESEKEMVAGAYSYHAVIIGFFNIFYPVFNGGTFYLHFILKHG